MAFHFYLLASVLVWCFVEGASTPSRDSFVPVEIDAIEALLFELRNDPVRLSAAQSSIINNTAQDIADAMCPFPMMSKFGCPIAKSPAPPSMMSATARAFREHIARHPTANKGKGNPASMMATQKNKDAHLESGGGAGKLGDGWQFYPPGSVPVGIGFDITSLEAKMPIFYPIVNESKNFFNSTVSQQAFATVEAYAASLDPSALQSIVAGSTNTDMNQIHNQYFQSFSGMHRNVQTDIVRYTTLISPSTGLLHMLPYLQWMIDTILPSTYDDAVYTNFIALFGTHIVTKAAVGGACEQVQQVSSCYLSGNVVTLNELATMQMAYNTGQYPTKVSFTSDYQEHTKIQETTMYGGDPTLANYSQWPQREATLLTAPVLIHVEEMVPIASYVTSNPTIQANIQKASAEWITNAQTRRANAIQAIRAAETFQVVITGQSVQNGFYFQTLPQSWGQNWCVCDPVYPRLPTTGCSYPCPFTGTLPVQSEQTVSMKPLDPTPVTVTLSSDACAKCVFPIASLRTYTYPNDLTVTCQMNNLGQVTATDVTSAMWELYREGPPGTLTPGAAVSTGCSVVTREYTSGNWSYTGANVPNPNYGGALYQGQVGTVTFEGWCCLNMPGPIAIVPYTEACVGNLTPVQCPNLS